MNNQHQKREAVLTDGHARQVAEMKADYESRILELIADKDAEKENSIQ